MNNSVETARFTSLRALVCSCVFLLALSSGASNASPSTCPSVFPTDSFEKVFYSNGREQRLSAFVPELGFLQLCQHNLLNFPDPKIDPDGFRRYSRAFEFFLKLNRIDPYQSTYNRQILAPPDPDHPKALAVWRDQVWRVRLSSLRCSEINALKLDLSFQLQPYQWWGLRVAEHADDVALIPGLYHSSKRLDPFPPYRSVFERGK